MKVTVVVSFTFLVIMFIGAIVLSDLLDVSIWKMALIAVIYTVLTTLRGLVVGDVYAWEKKKALGK